MNHAAITQSEADAAAARAKDLRAATATLAALAKSPTIEDDLRALTLAQLDKLANAALTLLSVTRERDRQLRQPWRQESRDAERVADFVCNARRDAAMRAASVRYNVEATTRYDDPDGSITYVGEVGDSPMRTLPMPAMNVVFVEGGNDHATRWMRTEKDDDGDIVKWVYAILRSDGGDTGRRIVIYND